MVDPRREVKAIPQKLCNRRFIDVVVMARFQHIEFLAVIHNLCIFVGIVVDVQLACAGILFVEHQPHGNVKLLGPLRSHLVRIFTNFDFLRRIGPGIASACTLLVPAEHDRITVYVGTSIDYEGDYHLTRFIVLRIVQVLHELTQLKV